MQAAIRTLYVATTNPGKLREFAGAASAHGVSILAVPGLERIPACVEDGATFEENARKKALHFAAYAPGAVFADDSGICVDMLGGAPGVYSARFAGEGATDAQNNQKLLEQIERVERETRLSGAKSPARTAHYACVIALAGKAGLLATVEGRVSGTLVLQPRGTGGFGYDPYFYYPPFGKTFAELSPEVKFQVSHRGHAFRKLLEAIEAPQQQAANRQST